MCVSTHEYHLMFGKNAISQPEVTEKILPLPPPPTEPRRLLEMTEKFCYYPPPHWIVSASGDHGKDSRNSSTSAWQLWVRVDVLGSVNPNPNPNNNPNLNPNPNQKPLA